nr:uncharacterized protein LOC109169230 [Ipomoea trifida]GMD21327.1 Catalase isozyme 1 [Ipomoea batatas]GMD22904.1 Catalase isozyme 1 [Ipomoea batatas]
MINSQISSNGMTSSGTGTPIFDKQLTGVAKKAALRDVQNQNGSLINNHRDSSLFLGTKLAADATRVCGNKRLTPERPSSSACHLSLISNGTNEHILNARRRFELELGGGRIHNDIDKYVEALQAKRLCQPQKDVPQKPNQLKENNNKNAPMTMPDHFTCSQGRTSATHSVGKSNKVTQPAQADSAKFTSDKPRSIDSKVADDQQRTERFANLQKILNQSDESFYSDYIKMLLRLSPIELSRHAVDLEKRAIQLAIDEGKEVNRGKALNILGKSAPTFTPLQTTQLLQPKNEQ